MLNRSTGNVSIIVPCYNEVETIGNLLTSIASQTYPMESIEVIIADGMSQDGTREKIRKFKEAHPELEVHLVDNPERIIPAALNKAVEKASGDVIVRLDAHSIPAPDYVERCVDVLESTRAANAGGVWEIRPGAGTWIARGIAAAAAHPLGAGGARYRVGGVAGQVDTVPFGAFRKDWLERIGRFDETLLTNEDYEYNVRIRAAGGEIHFDPGIRSIYLARSSLPALARQYARYGYWKTRMLSRYPDSARARQLIPPLFVLSILMLAALAMFLPPARWLLAVEWGIYASITFVSALFISLRRRDITMLLSFPLAVMTIHFAWGSAFIASAIQMVIGGSSGAR